MYLICAEASIGLCDVPRRCVLRRFRWWRGKPASSCSYGFYA